MPSYGLVLFIAGGCVAAAVLGIWIARRAFVAEILHDWRDASKLPSSAVDLGTAATSVSMRGSHGGRVRLDLAVTSTGSLAEYATHARDETPGRLKLTDLAGGGGAVTATAALANGLDDLFRALGPPPPAAHDSVAARGDDR